MSLMDSVFWWTGAAIAVAACVALAATALYVAAYAVKKACNAWWDRTLTIYRLESLRYYFSIMVANGRTGLLREVDASRREATGNQLNAPHNAASEWIPVSERLPDKSGPYLVFHPTSYWPIAVQNWLAEAGAWENEWHRKKRSEFKPKTWFTHWMPLPAEPESQVGGL